MSGNLALVASALSITQLADGRELAALLAPDQAGVDGAEGQTGPKAKRGSLPQLQQEIRRAFEVVLVGRRRAEEDQHHRPLVAEVQFVEVAAVVGAGLHRRGDESVQTSR